jgi:hypothetical protein
MLRGGAKKSTIGRNWRGEPGEIAKTRGSAELKSRNQLASGYRPILRARNTLIGQGFKK